MKANNKKTKTKTKTKKSKLRLPRFIKNLTPAGKLKLLTTLIIAGIKITTIIIFAL